MRSSRVRIAPPLTLLPLWVLLILLAGLYCPAAAQETRDTGDRKPKLTMRAQPSVGISPARVVFTAELAGGANDFEEFYCPTIEWDWGDDTRSESTLDCQPYEAGKSEIRRRYSVVHVFKRAGSFRVYFRLKQREKAVANATTTIQVRPGADQF